MADDTARLAYSLTAAAQASSLSVRSLRYLIRTGRLGYTRVGRRILIPHAELERLLRRASVKATETLDADAPIRPTSRTGKSNAPSGELGASNHGAGDTAPFLGKHTNEYTTS